MAHLYHTAATIQAYDQASDTCSIAFTGDGALETWIDGVKIDVTLSRAYCVAGAACTIALPDPSRLCDAMIVAVPQYSTPVSSQTIQKGRIGVACDANGQASPSVTFAQAYTSGPPTLTFQVDYPGSVTLVSESTTGFTASVSGGPANGQLGLTWQAAGV